MQMNDTAIDKPARTVAWDGERAWKNVLASANSRWFVERRSRHWPATAASRLERAVILPEIRPGFRLDPDDRIFAIGSCFARNIENHLMAQGFRVESQHVDIPGFEFRPPHSGVILNKFTTHSMLNELRWALDPACPFPEDALIEEGDGKWVDPQVVGEVAGAARDVVLARRPHITQAFARIRDCRVVVMTLGLVEAWFDQELGLYLNRAPGYWTVKKYRGRFALHLLDYRANRDALEQMYALLKRYGRSDQRWVLTVSPVPMSETFSGRDVLVANSYSKSTLRAVAEDFARAHERVEYYPSYESVSLSDRRVAFQDDLHHVTDALVDLNVRRFLDHYVGGGERAQSAEAAQSYADACLARVEGQLLVENARQRAELSALRAQLASFEERPGWGPLTGAERLSPGGVPLARDDRPLPASDRLQGNAEVGEICDDALLVSGWAIDRDDLGRPVRIVAFVDGRPAGYTTTAIPRPDVEAALQLSAPDAGFNLSMPRPPGAEPVVRLFALSAAGAARELGYYRPLYKLRIR